MNSFIKLLIMLVLFRYRQENEMYNPLNRRVSNNLKKYLPDREEKISKSNPYKKAKPQEQDPSRPDDPDDYTEGEE